MTDEEFNFYLEQYKKDGTTDFVIPKGKEKGHPRIIVFTLGDYVEDQSLKSQAMAFFFFEKKLPDRLTMDFLEEIRRNKC